MAQKTCSTCGGWGYSATERIPNPAGGMFQEIQVWKSCLSCGGTGSIWVPDITPYVAGKAQSSGGQQSA